METNSSILLPNYEIYVKPSNQDISRRKLEGFKKLAEIKQWGIKNPTKFLKEFIGVELLDAQEYIFMNSWTKPYAMWTCSRALGKTTLLALFAMTRGMLFNNYRIYICSGTADQSQETFKKIEDIALKNIESMTGLTDVFKNEVELLRENGHEVIEYTRNNDELKSSKLKLVLLPLTTIWSWKTFWEVRRIIKKEKINIVHCHNTFPLISPSVYYAARSMNVPVIQTIHNFRFLCPNGSFFCDGKVCET